MLLSADWYVALLSWTAPIQLATLNNVRQSENSKVSRLVIAAVLLLMVAVVGLSLALNNTIDTLQRLEDNAPKATGRVARRPNAPQKRIGFVDVGKYALQLSQSNPDAPDVWVPVYSSDFGTVKLHVMNRGQSRPLRIHQFAYEATAIVSGTPKVSHHYGREGKPVSLHARYSPGTVIVSPPFCGQEWANESNEQLQTHLVFATPPFAGPFYLKSNHQWLLRGKAPLIFNPEQKIASFRAQDQPFSMERLAYMNGRLSSFTVASRGEFGPFPGVTIVYVAKGRGTLSDDKKHTIAQHYLGLVPANQRVTVTATGETPLVMLLFRPQNDGLSDIIKKGKKRYSHGNEELLVREFFQDRKNGVFLDVGAGHYKSNSATFYLEEQLGWKGVAVDALAEYKAEYLKHRPNTKFVSYLITDQSKGKQKFFRSTAVPEVSSVSKELTQQWAKSHRSDDRVTEIEVQTITLTELLDQLNIDKLDFVSMDIEAHEPAALAGFDIDRFKPKLLRVEAHAPVRSAILKYFNAHNYIRINAYHPYDKSNWYFTPKEVDQRRPQPL